MSKATDLLSEEHRVIERVMSGLEVLVRTSLQQKRLDEALARMAIDFIKSFADRIHHGKEEDDLFARMVERGMSRQSGPLAVMLHEHELGRSCVKAMETNVSKAAEGDATSLAAFSDAAGEYIELLRNHIMKEDRVLYPMSDKILNEKDQEEMLARFEESSRHNATIYKKYLDMAETLTGGLGR